MDFSWTWKWSNAVWSPRYWMTERCLDGPCYPRWQEEFIRNSYFDRFCEQQKTSNESYTPVKILMRQKHKNHSFSHFPTKIFLYPFQSKPSPRLCISLPPISLRIWLWYQQHPRLRPFWMSSVSGFCLISPMTILQALSYLGAFKNILNEILQYISTFWKHFDLISACRRY